MLKKFLIGLGGLVVLIIIIAALSGGSEQQPQKVGEAGTDAPAATPQATPQEFRIGDRINIQDRILTVNSVAKDWKSKNEFDKPTSPNKVFVVARVTIENSGKDEVSFNTFDFKLQDANGVQVTAGFSGVGLDKLIGGQLIPGGKVSGDIIFDVNKDALQTLTLLYQPSFWSGQAARVLLQ